MFPAQKKMINAAFIVSLILLPYPLFSMHIMEGFLPPGWCIFWFTTSAPFILFGVISIKDRLKQSPKLKILLGLAGAYTFVLSSLKIPSLTGSSSHPTGVGLGAVLFGVGPMVVMGMIVLIFQALLLAHGGITTLGANIFSMAIVGPVVSWAVFIVLKKVRLSLELSAFLGIFLGSLATYFVTAIQLAMAFPDEHGGVMVSLIKFSGIFAVTQIPLSVSEGLLSVVIITLLKKYSREELSLLKVL